MADIKMCAGAPSEMWGASKCLKCYRKLAIPEDRWQDHFPVPPMKGGDCEYYWDIDEIEEQQKENVLWTKRRGTI